MQQVSLNKYFYLGEAFWFLMEVSRDSGRGLKRADVQRFLNDLLNSIKEIKLTVTDVAAAELKIFNEEFSKKEKNELITVDEAKQLNKAVSIIEVTLTSEMKTKKAFIVSEKRISVEKLLGEVSSLFPRDVFSKIPNIAQYDLNQSGKCIAFELPTAAAFHILRATEAILKNYYCSIIKRKRCDLVWAAMVVALSKTKSKNEVLLTNLDSLRKNYRNPTQHPDKKYDMDEVQDLFALCSDVINRMINSKEWETIQPILDITTL